MGFWSKLLGRQQPSADEAPEAPVPAPRPAEALPDAPAGLPASEALSEAQRRLAALGQPGGATLGEALALLQQSARRPHELAILELVVRALRDEPAHDPLRVACAQVLVGRGQLARALELVGPGQSVAAMMVAAELHAAQGDLARAVSTVERVLARAIDTPGARERHERWVTALGRNVRPRAGGASAGATVVASGGPNAPFRLQREVARGGAGTVYEAEDELLGRRVAFKLYHQPERDRGQVEAEAKRAAQLEGAGVVRIFDVDPAAGWLALEWVEGGTLRDLLTTRGRLGELCPLDGWVPKLLAALARVHDAGLVHEDLKPGNVLFRRPCEPLLGDFGLCCPVGTPSGGGTPGYLSPERLGGAAADPRDDVYAVGRILEDVLAAAQAAGALVSAAEHARYARLARACLRDATERPADATALLAALGQR